MSELLSSLTQPLAFGWMLLIGYLLWRLWRREIRRAVLPALVAAVVFVIGGTALPARLLASLERPYAGTDFARLPTADAVIMLGGTLSASTNDLFGVEWGGSVDRVITAAQVTRQTGTKVLVLGGGSPGRLPDRPESEWNRRWLETWPWSGAQILTLDSCRNTHDEAVRTKALADERGWKRLLLVTSASHLRRAEALFRKQGLAVVCVPCDFRGLAALENRRGRALFPGVSGFEQLDSYLHEVIGWWVYKARGWI